MSNSSNFETTEKSESEYYSEIFKKEDIDVTKKRRMFSYVCIASIVIFVSLCVLSVSIIIYILRQRSTRSSWNLELNEDHHPHTYTMIKNDAPFISTEFQSMKEVNEFSLYPFEHGVDVYLFQSSTPDYHEDPNSGYEDFELNEYSCTCDLEQLKYNIILEKNEVIRRGTTFENNINQQLRRSASSVVSGGMMIAGAISVLIMLWKTNEVHLRIIAPNEEQARKYTAKELSHRIFSEVIVDHPSSSYDEKSLEKNLENEIELISDCTKTDFSLFDFLRKKKDDFLRKKDDYTKQQQDSSVDQENVEDIEEGDDEQWGYSFERSFCETVCEYEEDEGNPNEENYFHCLLLTEWVGNEIDFGTGHIVDIGERALLQECKNYGEKNGMTFLKHHQFMCDDLEEQSYDQDYTQFEGFVDPGECSKDDKMEFHKSFSYVCHQEYDTDSCYEWLL